MTGSARMWGVRLGAVAWFVAGAAFLLSAPVLIQAWLFLLPIVAIVAFALALPLAWLWSKLARRPGFPGPWLKTGAALLFLLSAMVAAPVYYFAFSTQLRPALVPQVALTNGPKTIVIQGMQHVGTDRFFRGIVFDMEEALARGDVLFYEGVRSSDPESARWFSDTVAEGQNLTSAYRQIGSVCGLTFQNDYLKVVAADAVLHPDRHVTADVTTAELKQEYDRLMASDPAFAAAMRRKAEKGEDTDGVESILNAMTRGSSGQREVAGVTQALADALSKMEAYARGGYVNEDAERNPATSHMFIINPLAGRGADNLFSTHPSTQNRVAALMKLGGAAWRPAAQAAAAGPWSGQSRPEPRRGGTSVPTTDERKGPWG